MFIGLGPGRLADRHMARYVNAGHMVNFSTGDQHARFVPVKNVIRAVRSAVDAKLNSVSVMVETVQDRTVTRETVTNDPVFKRYGVTPQRVSTC